MTTNLATSETVAAASPLLRKLQIKLPREEVDRELKAGLRAQAQRTNAPGFRKGRARALPPALRREYEPRMLEMLLHRLGSPGLVAAAAEQDLRILPSAEIIAHEKVGDFYEVTFEIETMPEVPDARLEGSTLQKPVRKRDDRQIDEIVERIRRQSAAWQPVDRPAAMGDRVRFVLDSAVAGDQDKELELAPGLPEGLRDELVGGAAGQAVELDFNVDGSTQPAFKARITAVLEAVLPEVDLEFARRMVPGVGSLDEFRQKLDEQVASQFASQADRIAWLRLVRAIDTATAEFDLPNRLIRIEAEQRRQEVVKELGSRGHKLRLDQVPVDEFVAVARRDTRRRLIMQHLVAAEQVDATAAELDQELERQAADHEAPRSYIEQARSSPDAMAMVREQLVRAKLMALLGGRIAIVDEPMSLDELAAADRQEADLEAGREPPAAAPDSAGQPQ